MNKVYKYLKRYYMGFSKKYDRLLDCQSDDEIYEIFWKLWKKEHGGLFRLDGLYATEEVLPYRTKDAIRITDTGSVSRTFHQKYIKTLNMLILKNESDVLCLDMRGCSGGKPQVMIAGLLPLFKNGVLSYYYGKKRHRDVVVKDNIVICHSNNHATSTGTTKKRKYYQIDIRFDGQTASSAEQMIICLMTLKNRTIINLIGSKTAGYTTVNKYFQLSPEYGLEIPVGYMGTYEHVFCNGISPSDLALA